VLHPVRHTRAREAERRQSVFQCLELGETVNQDGDVRVVGHLRGASVQEQLWHKGADDSEWNTEFAETALQVGDDLNQAWFNA
jgi:hypothetical protein